MYEKRAPNEVSWFQVEARTSLELIEATRCSESAAIIDVGAGASTLVDGLVARGFTDITLLDIAETAFAETRRRLPAAQLHYLVADVTTWKPAKSFHVWHDRAVFHFLTEPADRLAYRSALLAALPSGGHAIIGTFASDGPERCSGLQVQRYSAEQLVCELGDGFRAVETRAERHQTPGGASQSFVFVRFVRR